jgi:hypothetical protein
VGVVTRRRDRLPPEIAARLDGGTVVFSCSDRGQHQRAVLGSASSLDGRRPRTWMPTTRYRVQQAGAGLFLDERGTVHLVCLRCRRHVRWRRDRAEAIVDELLRVELRELDVSQVPA